MAELDHPQSDLEPAAARLAEAVRYRTVSYEERERIEDDQFAAFGEFLERMYPRVHAELELRIVGHSRLYRWAGREDGAPAALLLAHQDVVPVDDEPSWTYPPFDGVIADGHVWGRGTIDDKSRVLATLEAVEAALADGWRPRRTVYLAFGHDEEIGGEHGAAKVAELLAAEGVMADFVLDEGGVIGVGLIDGVPVPTATIMVGEKGFVTVRLSTSDVGGHASMPPRRTAVGRLARAVAALQDKPMPLRVTEPVREMVARVAPYLPGVRGTLLAKVAKWDKALARVLAMRPQTASLVRTTTAPTVIRGGVKPNVLPQTAEAFVNFRILHGDTVDDVLAHCRRVVRDKQVSVELAPGERAEPSPVSSTDSPHFRLLGELTTAVVPEAAVTTGLVPGATDARHYHRVARERFGFAPILMDSTELDRIHGTDERLSLDNYARLIRFTGQLLRRL
jgi:carboxypeptidase PM20D1